MRWKRWLGLRSRLTLLTAGVVAVGLLVGGVIVTAALGFTLQRSVDNEARQAGADVAALIAENALSDPIPVAGDQVVQVVDDQGRVLAASINADRLVPMLRDRELAQLGEGGRTFVDGERIGVEGLVRVVAVPATEGRIVLVAKSMADLRHSMRVVNHILLVAFPLLLAGLVVITWRLVGATLRPVEALRAGAADISTSGRPATLPIPEAHDEIHRLAVTLNDMLARLETARAQQRAFVADAAHELRSPLANMRTELEVAQRLGAGTDWPELVEDLLADTKRLARLVDDLLLLARVDEAPAAAAAAEPVELGSLLRSVAQRYAGARAQVTVDDSPEAWTLGEPEALRRVVANLVDNAVRHAQSQVTLAVVPGSTQHLVTVVDDGPGIPAADRERVFGRFTRLDDARARDAGGAGLGLAIVRELVRRHGGTVRLDEADPRTGSGLRAEVRLPAAPEHDLDSGG